MMQRSLRHHLRHQTESAHLALHRHPGFAAIEAGTISAANHRCLMGHVGGFYACLDPLMIRACDTLKGEIGGYQYQPRAKLFPDVVPKSFDIGGVDSAAALAGVSETSRRTGKCLATYFQNLLTLLSYFPWSKHS